MVIVRNTETSIHEVHDAKIVVFNTSVEMV